MACALMESWPIHIWPMDCNGDMADAAVQPFDTIESAHEFMVVLENVIAEAQIELESLLASNMPATSAKRKLFGWRCSRSRSSTRTRARAAAF